MGRFQGKREWLLVLYTCMARGPDQDQGAQYIVAVGCTCTLSLLQAEPQRCQAMMSGSHKMFELFFDCCGAEHLSRQTYYQAQLWSQSRVRNRNYRLLILNG